MRHSIFILITAFFCAGAVFPTMANAQAILSPDYPAPYTENQISVYQYRPFNLAFLAYQGYLKDQGIPSNGALVEAISSRTITARDIIQAAVKEKRLPEQMLSNQSYRYRLDNILRVLAGH